MKKKSIILILAILKSTPGLCATDSILLSQILSQSVSQLKELHEILKIQNASLDEIEKANITVKDAQYRILRAKYIIDSTKEFNTNRINDPQGALNFLRKTRNKTREIKDFMEINWWEKSVDSIPPEEKKKILEELERLDYESKDIAQQLQEKKIQYVLKKRYDTNLTEASKNDNESIGVLVNNNLYDSSDRGLSPNSASILNARNTALTNKILKNMNDTHINTLESINRINEREESKRLEELKKIKSEKDLWNLPKK